VWPLRADARSSWSFDVTTGLSGNTFTSESTNQAEMLSRGATFADREKKQINQTRNLSIISSLSRRRGISANNPLLRRHVLEQILSRYLKDNLKTLIPIASIRPKSKNESRQA